MSQLPIHELEVCCEEADCKHCPPVGKKKELVPCARAKLIGSATIRCAYPEFAGVDCDDLVRCAGYEEREDDEPCN